MNDVMRRRLAALRDETERELHDYRAARQAVQAERERLEQMAPHVAQMEHTLAALNEVLARSEPSRCP